MPQFSFSDGRAALEGDRSARPSGRTSRARFAMLFILLLIAMTTIGCHRVRHDGTDAVIGFSWTVILAVTAVPLIAIAIGLLLCRDEERRPAGLCTVLTAALLAIVVVPCIALDTIRITDEKIEHRTGFWFWPNRKEFRYEEMLYMTVSEHTNLDDSVEIAWTVHLRNGKSRDLDVGDLWESATVDLIDELRAHGVDVRTPPF